LATCGCDGTNELHVYDTLSGLNICTLMLTSRCVMVTCQQRYVMVVTQNSHVSVWDFATRDTIVNDISLLPLLADPNVHIISGQIHFGTHMPIIVLSSARSYIYSNTLKSWQLIYDKTSSVQRLSLLSPTRTSDQQSSQLAQTIGQSEKLNTTSQKPVTGASTETTQLCQTATLERRYIAACACGTDDEKMAALKTLVQHLAHIDNSSKLQYIVRELTLATKIDTTTKLATRMLQEVKQLIANNPIVWDELRKIMNDGNF